MADRLEPTDCGQQPGPEDRPFQFGTVREVQLAIGISIDGEPMLGDMDRRFRQQGQQPRNGGQRSHESRAMGEPILAPVHARSAVAALIRTAAAAIPSTSGGSSSQRRVAVAKFQAIHRTTWSRTREVLRRCRA